MFWPKDWEDVCGKPMQSVGYYFCGNKVPIRILGHVHRPSQGSRTLSLPAKVAGAIELWPQHSRQRIRCQIASAQEPRHPLQISTLI